VSAPDHLVHVVRPIDGDDDRAADAAAWTFRFGVSIPTQVLNAKQRLQRAAKLEHDEVAGIQHQRPAKTGQSQQQPSDRAKWVHLANLRDRTEVLFYRLLTEHISDMLSVGTAIQRLSREFRRGRGVRSSAAHLDQVETALRETV